MGETVIFGKREIQDAYLGAGSAGDVAARLNKKFGTDIFTARHVEAVWDMQWRKGDPLLRSLGHRPETGFSQDDDKIKLAKQFAKVPA
jgi:hypothetical protein